MAVVVHDNIGTRQFRVYSRPNESVRLFNYFQKEFKIINQNLGNLEISGQNLGIVILVEQNNFVFYQDNDLKHADFNTSGIFIFARKF